MSTGGNAGLDPFGQQCPQRFAGLNLQLLDPLPAVLTEAPALAVGEYGCVAVLVDDLAVGAECRHEPVHRVVACG